MTNPVQFCVRKARSVPRSGLRGAQTSDALDQLRLGADVQLSVDRLQVISDRMLADVGFYGDGGNALPRREVNQDFALPVRE